MIKWCSESTENSKKLGLDLFLSNTLQYDHPVIVNIFFGTGDVQINEVLLYLKNEECIAETVQKANSLARSLTLYLRLTSFSSINIGFVIAVSFKKNCAPTGF
jgi:hypothetical protein